MASSAAAAATGADWASLPVDLLGCIAERLFLVDYIRFGAVCTSWSRAVFPKTTLYLPLAPMMPSLLLPGEDRELSDHCFLFNLADRRLHRLSALPALRDRWFVGSQFGWLVIADFFANPSLLNPLTGSQIPLPPIFPPPFIDPIYKPDGSLVGYRTESGESVGTQQHPSCFGLPNLLKIVLSSNPMDGSFEAVAMYSFQRQLLFLRSGEEKWYESDWPYCFDDAIYHNGEFLLITAQGHLMALDLSVGAGASARMVMVDFASSDEEEIDSASSEEEEIDYVSSEGVRRSVRRSRYLVDSGGDLIQVCREIVEIAIRGHGLKASKVSYFSVTKWDDENSYWEPVETLGGRSLFVGTASSFSLAAYEIPGLKINCIYFTDEDWVHVENVVCDIGVFSLEDGSVEYCHPNKLGLNWPLPIWISPALSWMDRRRPPN